MLESVPQPLVLDPDRVTTDDRSNLTAEEHRSRAQQLDTELHKTCEYAQQLWLDVARARQYLYDSLPPDPHDPSADRACASPSGPDDDEGWQRWIDAYAELTSVLTGPHGDSGLGATEARLAAQARRSVPADRAGTPAADAGGAAGDAAPAQPAPGARHAATPQAAPPPDAPVVGPGAAAAGDPGVLVAKRLALGALVVLAARGLRPGRRAR